MRRPNVPGVAVGGGVLGAMLLKYVFGESLEITGALLGLFLALIFVTRENFNRDSDLN